MKLYEKVLEKDKCTFTKVYQSKSPRKWLELRKTGLGGSDAGSVCGLNSYKSPLQLYYEKISNEENDFTESENTIAENGSYKISAIEWGSSQEPHIRSFVEKKLCVQIETVPGMFRSKEFSFMNANLDGLVLAENPLTINQTQIQGLGGIEIKTSRFGKGFDDDEIPDAYYCQVQHYMAVTGLEWFILVALVDRELKTYVVKRNEKFIAELVECETNFWENNVLRRIAPAPIGTESDLSFIKSQCKFGEVNLDDTFLEQFQSLDITKSEISRLEKKAKEIESTLLVAIQERAEDGNGDLLAKCGNYVYSLKNYVRKCLNTELLKKDGLYEQYLKATEYKRSNLGIAK